MKTLTMNEVEQVSGGFIGGLLTYTSGAFVGTLLMGQAIGYNLGPAILAAGLPAQGAALAAGAVTGAVVLNALYNAGSNNHAPLFF